MARGIPPQAEIENIDQDKKQKIVGSLQELVEMGKPETNTALRERIGYYFDLCREGRLRPGMGTLRLAIGVSKTTLYDWSRGNHCDEERHEIIRTAKDMLEAYLEQAMFDGQINPIPAIFMLKSYFGYNELMNEEIKAEQRDNRETRNVLSAAELPKLGCVNNDLPTIEVPHKEERVVLSASELPKLG